MDYIISRAPLRISLASAADTVYFLETIPDGWGNALSMCIGRYSFCFLTPSSSGFYINSSLIAPGNYYQSLDDLLNGLPKRGRPIDMVEATIGYFLRNFDMKNKIESLGVRGFQITSSVDTPPESGLGGSASSMVAILGALYELCGIKPSKKEIVNLAYHIERDKDYLGIPGGIQDQIAAVYGGINYMEFHLRDGEIEFSVYPLSIDIDRFLKNLLLVRVPREYSGKDIHLEQEEKSRTMDIRSLLVEKRNNVLNLKNLLETEKYDKIGDALNKDMEIKRELGSVETEITRLIFQAALTNGAKGGRIIGAGRGGCMTFYCEDKEKVWATLRKYGAQLIDFDFSHTGLSVVRGGF